jgi:hypothetical protein
MIVKIYINWSGFNLTAVREFRLGQVRVIYLNVNFGIGPYASRAGLGILNFQPVKISNIAVRVIK